MAGRRRSGDPHAGPGGWRSLLESGTAELGLGAYAYQIDGSAIPPKKAREGRPPSDARMELLLDAVIPLLRATARVLLLQGFGGNRWLEWKPRDQRQIQAFLNLQSAPGLYGAWTKVGGRLKRGNKPSASQAALA